MRRSLSVNRDSTSKISGCHGLSIKRCHGARLTSAHHAPPQYGRIYTIE